MSSHPDNTNAPSGNKDFAHDVDSTSDTAGSDAAGNQSGQPKVVGWREWVSLPDLGLPAIKAKIDTGARTSAIHAFDIKRFERDNGEPWVAFSVLPVQRESSIERRCEAPLVDIRTVTDSGGHKEERYFISTRLVIGDQTRLVEITLAQRNDMLFRMLLGRTTLVPGIIVNPELSYACGRVNARSVYNKLQESGVVK